MRSSYIPMSDITPIGSPLILFESQWVFIKNHVGHFKKSPISTFLGERFDFKFALFEHDTLKFWENLPGNRNRRYTPTYGRVHLKGVFGELDGDEIIEKRLPSFSNMPGRLFFKLFHLLTQKTLSNFSPNTP